MYKPPPRAGADQGHQEERTPQQGPIMARSPNNPTRRGRPVLPKENITRPPPSKPPKGPPATTSRRGYLASIFGTLLSSQGSSAHRHRPSGQQSGQLFELTRSATAVSTSLPASRGCQSPSCRATGG